MGSRVRQSSGGIRSATLSAQLILAASAFIGFVSPPPDQSASDQALAPLVWVMFVCLLALAVRTAFIGVYLYPGEIRVRSWLRTYHLPVVAGTRFAAVPWEDWFLSESVEYHLVQMISVEGSIRRSFSATAVRRSRAIAQCDLLNAYVQVTAQSGASATLAHDFARGSAWRDQRKKSQARQAARRVSRPRHSAAE